MIRIRQAASVAFVALLASTIGFRGVAAAESAVSAGAQPDVLATVNGSPVNADYAAVMLRDRGIATSALDGLRDEVNQRLVTTELLVQEARRRGLDKDPDVKLRSEMLQRDVLANAFVQSYLREHPIGEAEIKAEYERRKQPLAGAKEYSVRHILVADRTVAQALIKDLKAGADFAKLADERSLDEGASRNYGGSLGWISLDNGEKDLVDAVRGLDPGQIVPEPVRTRFGWHVLRLDAVRDVRVLPYEEVRGRLQQSLQQAQVAALERDLRAKATVVWPAKEQTAYAR